MITKKLVEDIICKFYIKALMNLPEDVRISLENVIKFECPD